MESGLKIGEQYRVQFVWKLPNYDYIRAIFEVSIVAIDLFEERYIVKLESLVGGRQEAPDGSMRAEADMTKQLWARVVGFIGRKVRLPYESADGHPLHLKYPTLTGEHNFFTRFEDTPSLD